MNYALVNRAPALAIFSCHDLAYSAFHCLALLISGLLLRAHALALRCRLCFLLSLPNENAYKA
jgi:hypothetical protein